MDSTGENAPELGSLAQAARGKQIKKARKILIVVGILTIVGQGIFTVLVPSQVKQEVDQEVQHLRAGGRQIDPEVHRQAEAVALRIAYVICGAIILQGVLFVFLGLIVQRYPVPVTVISLVVFIGVQAILAMLHPANLLMGWLIKIIFVVALVKALQAAIAHQKEQPAVTLEPSHE